jgi:hypothetical protein
MIRVVPARLIYFAFAAAFVLATVPVWRLWLFGFTPGLDDLLSLRCFAG